MFRYVAFTWDALDQTQGDLVRSFTHTLQAATEDWHIAFDSGGMRVLCAGERDGAMRTYPLDNRSGVILGTLFTRSREYRPASLIRSLRHDESRCIAATHGRTLIDSYWGRYVAFLRDVDDGTLRVIRDPVGDIECLEASHSGVRVFFSSLNDCPLSGRIRLTPNRDYIAASLSFPMLDQRETGLCEVTRVLAGQCVEIRGRDMSRKFYWDPAAHARSQEISDPVVAAQRLRETARACVHAWASCYPSLLLKLSGGLDSSILLALMADAPTQPDIVCANLFCPGDRNSDEREYARIVARRAGKALIVYEPEPAFDARRLLAMPLFHSPSNLLPVVACNEPAWKIARTREIPATFTGVGGDQLFFISGSTYACADYIFRHGLDRRAVALAIGAARNRKISLWQALMGATSHAWGRDRWGRLFSTYTPPEFVSREVASSVLKKRLFLHPWLSDTDDLPPGKVMHILGMADTFGVSVTAPFSAPNDPDYVQPLFSQPLKELCLQIPVDVLAIGGRSRALARTAFASQLPSEIRQRRDKGGPHSYIRQLVARNLELMREVVLDGTLVRERIVNRDSAERLLSGALLKDSRAAPHACQLFSTEAWLSRWAEHRRSAAAA